MALALTLARLGLGLRGGKNPRSGLVSGPLTAAKLGLELTLRGLVG